MEYRQWQENVYAVVTVKGLKRKQITLFNVYSMHRIHFTLMWIQIWILDSPDKKGSGSGFWIHQIKKDPDLDSPDKKWYLIQAMSEQFSKIYKRRMLKFRLFLYLNLMKRSEVKKTLNTLFLLILVLRAKGFLSFWSIFCPLNPDPWKCYPKHWFIPS